MPRLFTGLEIPADTGLRLSFLRGGLHRAVWIDQESYHITLRFIGDIDDRSADEVADALSRIRRKSFDVTITGIDSFGGPRPHSVFARVEPCAALMELQAEQERILQRLGFEPEGRKFTPHVTIARTKGSTQRDVVEWLTIRGGFTAGSFKADRFVLFSSKASRGGGPYIVEEAYPLIEGPKVAPIPARLPRLALSEVCRR
jgi:2'-5' RNA ligase